MFIPIRDIDINYDTIAIYPLRWGHEYDRAALFHLNRNTLTEPTFFTIDKFLKESIDYGFNIWFLQDDDIEVECGYYLLKYNDDWYGYYIENYESEEADTIDAIIYEASNDNNLNIEEVGHILDLYNL